MGACGGKDIEGDVDVYIDGKETGFKTYNGIKVSSLKSEIAQFGHFKIEDLAIVPQNLDTEFGDDQEVNVVGDEHIEVFNLSDMTANQELKAKLLEKRNEHKHSDNPDDNDNNDAKSPRATKTEEVNQSHSKSKRKSKKSSSKKSDDKNKSSTKSDSKDDQKSGDEPNEPITITNKDEAGKESKDINDHEPSSGDNPQAFGGFSGGFGDDKGGFGDDKGGFGEDKGEFGEDKGGFGEDKGGFGNDNGGFGGEKGFEDDKGGFGSDDKDGFGGDKDEFGEDKDGFGPEKGFGDDKGGFGEDKGGFGSDDKDGFGGDKADKDNDLKSSSKEKISQDRKLSGEGFGGQDSGFDKNESGFGDNKENNTNQFSDEETNFEKVAKQKLVTENIRKVSNDNDGFNKASDDEFGKNDNSDFGQEDGVFNGFGPSAQLGEGDNPFETDESNQFNNSSEDHMESRITEKSSRSPSPPKSMTKGDNINTFVNDENDTFDHDSNNINDKNIQNNKKTSFNQENDNSFEIENNTNADDDFGENNQFFKDDDNSFDNKNDSFKDEHDNFNNINRNNKKINLSDNSDSFEYKNSFGDENDFNDKNDDHLFVKREIIVETTKTVRSQVYESQKPIKDADYVDNHDDKTKNIEKDNTLKNDQIKDFTSKDRIDDDRINSYNKYTDKKSQINSEINSKINSINKQYSSSLPNKDDTIKTLQEKINNVKQSFLQNHNSNTSSTTIPKYRLHTLTPRNDDSDDEEFIDHGIAEIINNNKRALEQAMLFSQQLTNYQRSLGSPTTNPTYRKYIVSDSDSDDNH